ncbi:MAG: methionyl-tRNA formyltransferase [Candidatus Saganbacteria bacterium]|nr:methionyl-tRNA formyltransferase [Candidatus Saganbacteria bacterium]
MRIVFMGTPAAAAKILQALVDAKQEIIAVVTQPDRPQGRGLKVYFSPVKELALQYNLPLLQPEKVKEPIFVAELCALKPDLIIVVAYGQILSGQVLEMPKYGCINVHASLLPKYRGASPIEYAILKGEKETGISIMRVQVSLDTGPVLLQDKLPISAIDTTGSLESKLFEIAVPLTLKAIKLIEQGKAEFIKQDESKASYASRIRKEEGVVDWKKSAMQIDAMVRAFDPWPGAYTYYNKKSLKICRADRADRADKVFKAGEIVEIVKNEGFKVATGDGILMVLEVQAEAGKRMNAYDFVMGHKLQVGEVLPN